MWCCIEGCPISRTDWEGVVERVLSGLERRLGPKNFKRALLLPPDITRFSSGAGAITSHLYARLTEQGVRVQVIPTLGQHQPHGEAENQKMFPGIPEDCIIKHDWLTDCDEVGVVSAETVAELTEGAADWPIPIELSRQLLRPEVDAVINLGRVVPHEIFGMSNHNKNIFIGLGGKRTLCSSHLASACYGIERCLGRLTTPVRSAFDSVEGGLLGGVLNLYILLVRTPHEDAGEVLTGLYVGEGKEPYKRAARYAQQHTIRSVGEGFDRAVCFVDADHKSTWVANKAIYRTRLAMKEGGRLLVVAPGVKRFGEQQVVDRLIRRHGYKGRDAVLEACVADAELKEYGNAAAHLIHGSSEGRFLIDVASPHLSKEEVEGVGYGFVPFNEAMRYVPSSMKEGTYDHKGKKYTFIPNPDRGLWAATSRLQSHFSL